MKRESETPTVYYFSSHHPVNESLVRSPPAGVSFKSNVTPIDFENTKKPKEYGRLRRVLKQSADNMLWCVLSPRRILILEETQLIHTEGGVVPLNRHPWILGMEHVSAFFGFNDAWQFSPTRRARLLKLLLSSNCKHILAYSKASLETLDLAFPKYKNRLRSRAKVLYPAVDVSLLNTSHEQEKKHSGIRLLFVGNHFFDKGGRELVAAYMKLRDKLDISIDFVTEAPSHHARFYKRYLEKLDSDPNLRFTSRISRNTLLQLYTEADIFCFPSYMETFGFVILEAMAAGLPVICSDAFALPELVQDGVNGLLVHTPLSSFERGSLRTPSSLEEYRRKILDKRLFGTVVHELVKKIHYLAENDSVRRSMGKQSLLLVREGRFSVRFRNQVLKNVYLSALRDVE